MFEVQRLGTWESSSADRGRGAADLAAAPRGDRPCLLDGREVKQGMDGTWKGAEQTFDGIGAGMVIIGPLSDKIPDSVKKEAMEIRDGIASGTLHSFTGPINKQDGSPWLKAGETADMGTLLGMNFYVEGIEGDIPQ